MVRCRKWSRWATLGALVIAAGLGGCCNEDTAGFLGRGADPTTAVGQVGVEVPPIEVEPPSGPVKIDVMFLLDDSEFITSREPEPGTTLVLGEILTPGDGRIKTDVAQEIFDDAVDELLSQLESDGIATADEVDLAFGVSRYEDFANFERSGPKASDTAAVADPIDEEARPFILNQPILRQEHPQFAILFGSALSRETPGDGGRDPFDGQAGLEALYQLSTGDGFDGNGDGTTTQSGPAGELDTQLLPGNTGDVPAFAFVSAGDDPDGEPVYQVGDTLSSGSIGGAGWRPDSIRFIVVFSDLCTITPLLADTDLDGSIDNTPSADGEGPRGSETVDSVQAFACSAGEETLNPDFPGPNNMVAQQAYARFGHENGSIPVAPDGAATLQAVIDALNERDIEVLGIGIREAVGSGPNKPNVLPPSLPGEEPAVPDPEVPPENKAPFTWMSGVAILTGARDTTPAADEPDPRYEEGLPLVYDLTTVNPSDEDVTDDLTEDLADRIEAWLPFKENGAGPGDDPGSVYMLFTFDIANPSVDLFLDPEPGFPLLPGVDPGGDDPIYLGAARDGDGIPIPGTQIVRIPCYYAGETPPSAVRVAWQFNVTRVDLDLVDLLGANMPFEIEAALALDPGAFPPDTWPGDNPTGPHEPGDVPVPGDVGGNIAVVLPVIEIGGDTPSVTLVVLGEGDEALFRDVRRGIPDGDSIFTMAGPLGNDDLPFPSVSLP